MDRQAAPAVRGPGAGPARIAGRDILRVQRTAAGLATVHPAYQAFPIAHPLLDRLSEPDLHPVLAVQVHAGTVQAHLSLLAGKRLLDKDALPGRLTAAAGALGWSGLDGLKLKLATNALQGRSLVVRSSAMAFGIGRFLEGHGKFEIIGANTTFEATATGEVDGLAKIELPISRTADGSLTGSVDVDVKYKNFSGHATATFGHGLVDVLGTVSYNTERLSGEATIVATDAASAKALTDSRTPAQAEPAAQTLAREPASSATVAHAAAEPVVPATGPRPGPRVVVGWGTMHATLTDWLGGDALVIVDAKGHVTIVGKITAKMRGPLVAQQPEKSIKSPTLALHAEYGIPVLADIFIEAGISLEAYAVFGPVTLDQIELTGTWSTNPETRKNFGLTGTLNASAAAGLRLFVYAKAGLEVLRHKVAIGAGVTAFAEIRGYVQATPQIGYREVADPQAGKRGEFFIGGHLEAAAQPFLGLSGILFVELTTPWWSPIDDHRWDWPLGSLEYAVPAMIGIGLDFEHVLGSGKVPEFSVGEVAFDREKFFTDVVHDNVPPKTSRDQRHPGSWQEKLPPPAAGAPAVARAGPTPAAARPTIQPSGARSSAAGGKRGPAAPSGHDGRSLDELKRQHDESMKHGPTQHDQKPPRTVSGPSAPPGHTGKAVPGKGPAAGPAAAIAKPPPLPDVPIEGPEPHVLIVVEQDGMYTLMIHSPRLERFAAFLTHVEKDDSISGKLKKVWLPEVEATFGAVKSLLQRRSRKGQKATSPHLITQMEEKLARAVKGLLTGRKLGRDRGKYELEGLVGTYSRVVRGKGDRLTPDHQPQASLLLLVAKMKAGPGSRELLFAGRRIRTMIRGGHVDEGWAINLHEQRHRAGRTYGTPVPDTVRENICAIQNRSTTNNEKEEDRKERIDEVIGIVKGQRDADVTAMEEVIDEANRSEKKIWGDIDEIFGVRGKGTPEEAEEKKAEIAKQICAGEKEIKAQKVESWFTDPG